MVFSDHARLGVVLRQEKNPATDPIGAVIEALTPGSPAEEAGLRPGDIITKFNGRSLTTGEVDSDEDESAPTARLMDLASSLKDGDVVTLEYRRGSATATATLTARSPVGPHVRVVTVPRGMDTRGGTSIEIPDIPDMPDIPDFDIDLDFHGGRAWRDVDLIALNPELGRYFGSSDGVLVVRAPKESSLKLQGGDVILKIGDRTPATPTQAMRILRSYEPGENGRRFRCCASTRRSRSRFWSRRGGRPCRPIRPNRQPRLRRRLRPPPAPPAAPRPPAPGL